MKNPFLKYIMKEKKEDIFHSSAYGKVQSADAMGTASVETFDERMKVERNRQIVRGYNDSRIASRSFAEGPRAKKYVPSEKKQSGMKRGDNLGDGVRGGTNKAPAQAPSQVKRSFMPPIKPKFG